MKTVNDYNFKNKKALIRVDFNVPLNEDLEVGDTSRIEAAKPTIIKILEDGGSAILMSHLGRPEGVEDRFSLRHIEPKVSEILGVEVKFVADSVGDQAQKAAQELFDLVARAGLRLREKMGAEGETEFQVARASSTETGSPSQSVGSTTSSPRPIATLASRMPVRSSSGFEQS